jgi:hypothetical protein
MSDFLHKLRSGNDLRNGNDTRFNKKRRQYDNGQGVVYDRRVVSKDAKRKSPHKQVHNDKGAALPTEVLHMIKDLLQDISDKQERLAMAEERKANALEAIVEHVKSEKGISISLKGDMIGAHSIFPKQKRKRRAKKFEDPNRKRVLQIISSMRKRNETYQDIADRLEKEDLKTFSGRGKWHAQTVHRLCQD